MYGSTSQGKWETSRNEKTTLQTIAANKSGTSVLQPQRTDVTNDLMVMEEDSIPECQVRT